MKLTILVPSEEYHASAGARIRYGGLAEGLLAAGITMRLESLADFDPCTTDCDALLISKCHDARSIIAATILSRRGKLVGVDLFDDYFSQRTDSRLVRYRQWFSEVLQECHFCLCSTEPMAEVVRGYAPDLPIHVVNDPARDHDPEEACRLADAKAADARRNGVLRAVWFGVGDNPLFPVGLIDLFAHSPALSQLARSEMAVELTVLTNRRALSPEGLELIAKLPVPCTVIEWTEEVEREVLEESVVAILPVGAQAFSAAKSLNRAWTALTFGCQILSRGLPLYAALDPLIYREANELLSDLQEGRLRLSAETLDSYRARLHEVGSAEAETERLSRFLRGLVARPAKDAATLCVIHGLATRAEVHHLTHAVDGVSVASPYCTAKLDFDVYFSGSPGHLRMALSSRGSERTRDRSARINGKSQLPSKPAAAPVAYQLATYTRTMGEIRRRLEEAFGRVRVIVSETSRLPLAADVEA